MIALLQRVTRASVTITGPDGPEIVGAIGPGLLALVGVVKGDTPESALWLARKVAALRIFADDAGKMNRSVLDVGGEVLAVSQFTLAGDCRRGTRPGFDRAAPPDVAISLYEGFMAELRTLGLRVSAGRFGAMMAVELVNDGPVTLWVEGP